VPITTRRRRAGARLPFGYHPPTGNGAGPGGNAMFEWFRSHEVIVGALVGASVVVFVVSLLATPALVARIRPDYFAHDTRPPSLWADRGPLVRRLLRLGRNLLGVVFMLGGIIMLVTPGQGLLTLLIGFLLVDFPGKYRLEKWLVRRRWVLRPINWMRRRAGRDPLQVERTADRV
jgi:hypothetical protein